MKRALPVILCLTMSLACSGPQAADAPATSGPASAYEPAGAERAEIVAALQSLFDALRTGDSALLRDVMEPDVVMRSTETNAAGVTSFSSSTVDGLASRIESSDVPLIERMWDPVVRVSGSMATIWTPYDFYSGDTFSHCGVDAATLMRGDDGWKITALSWTRLQPPSCPLHPDGPPSM